VGGERKEEERGKEKVLGVNMIKIYYTYVWKINCE
jgi:hypothetical protein